ncbi:MAG: hypothetical protein ACOCV2_15315, partial [Persicimonas sp.]
MTRPRQCIALLFALMLPLLSSCGERDTTIELDALSMPEGGTVQAVASVDDGDQRDVVVPTTTGLFRLEDQRWRLLEPSWPDDLPDQYSAPLRALANATA